MRGERERLAPKPVARPLMPMPARPRARAWAAALAVLLAVPWSVPALGLPSAGRPGVLLTFSADGSGAHLGRASSPPTNVTALGPRDLTDRLRAHPPGMPAPVDFFGKAPGVRFVDVGPAASFAIAEDGGLYSWGTASGAVESPSRGVLGRSADQPPRERPGAIKNAPRFVAVASGHDHAVALTDEGTLYTWGGNAFHQLARPATSRGGEACRSGPSCADASPVRAETSRTFGVVDAGPYYGVAARKSKGAVAWGLTACGLEHDSVPVHEQNRKFYVRGTPPARLMTPVIGLEHLRVVQVAAGGRHTAFLTDEHRVFTCATGFDERGRRVASTLPGAVPPAPPTPDAPAPPFPASMRTDLGLAEFSHRRGVLGPKLRPNYYGELGRDSGRAPALAVGPLEVPAGARFTQVAAGACFTLLVDAHGSLWSVGCPGPLLRRCDSADANDLGKLARKMTKFRRRYEEEDADKRKREADDEALADARSLVRPWASCHRLPRPVPWVNLLGRERAPKDAVRLVAAGNRVAAAVLEQGDVVVWGRSAATWGGVNQTVADPDAAALRALNLSRRGKGRWAGPLALAAGGETFALVVASVANASDAKARRAGRGRR